MTYQTVTK